MKAVICSKFTSWSDLCLGDLPIPTPAPGEVAVQVKAAGYNFPDTLLVAGKYQIKPDLPFVPGSECAGIITALGEGVSGWSVGDRVIAYTVFGAMAEHICVPAARMVLMPDAMDFASAAAITTTYGTSYYALKQRANLIAGETVLVLGAAGGVGLAATELAKAAGAMVIAAASTDEKCALARAHGADFTINYTDEDLRERVKDINKGRGVDVVYDPVGGDVSETAFRLLAFNGRHLVVGFAAGTIAKLPLNLPLLKTASLVGVFWGAWATHDPAAHEQNMRELVAMYGAGKIKVTVSKQIPLADFATGFCDLAERRAQGKLVLVMGDNI